LIIGIDLGTTKSVVGFMKAGGPVIIPDAQGRTSIPSLVLVTPSEKIFVGHAARNHPDFYHGKSITISSVKRLMGKQGETGWGWWKTYPQEVSAFILAELRKQAEIYLHQEVRDAVIAIPSHFDESQRRATKEAAHIAGLNPLRLLNEANAAALAYGVDLNRDEKILVFDFGGGTLDVAIMEMGEGVFEVKCIEGDSRLGGDDFDEIIFKYVMEQCRQQHGDSLELTPAQAVFLREAACRAKVELSQSFNTTIHYPAFFKIDNRHVDLLVPMDRSTFERLSQPLFDRAAAILRESLKDAGLGKSDLHRVLLLGGSSRIPYLGEMIERELGIRPFRGVDPDLAVAQGAVLQAGMLRGEVKNILLLDMIPGSYGIETLGGEVTRLIERNSAIPTRGSFISTTTQDNQSSVAIRVFQGERKMAADNLYLETVILDDIPPAPKGVPQIEVRLDVDANMIVHASAKDLATGKERSTLIQSPYGLNPAQVKLMSHRIAGWLARRQRAGLEHIALQITQAATDLLLSFPQALSGELFDSLQNEQTRLLTYMQNDDEIENLSASLSRFEKIYQEANLLVARYAEKIKEINTLRRKIDSLVGVSPPEISSIGSLLIQGKELLLDFQNRRLPFEELQKLFLSVRAEYENARVLVVCSVFKQLMASEEVSRWEQEIPEVMPYPQLREYHLARLLKFTNVEQFINHLDDDDPGYRRTVFEKAYERLRDKPRELAFFITLTTVFADFNYEKVEKELGLMLAKEAHSVLAIGLFAGGLHPDKPEPHRQAAAWLISQLPPHDYLPALIDSSLLENSPKVKENLLLYLPKHPDGTLYKFILRVGSEKKEAICRDILIIKRLLMESQDDSILLALGHLRNFSFNEVLPLLAHLFKDTNPIIRSKALEHLLAMEYKGDQVRELILKELRDPEIEIRTAAYSYLPKLNDEYFLAIILELIKKEKNDLVRGQAILALAKMAFPGALPTLLLLSLEPDEKLSSSALAVLEEKAIADKDSHRLFELIKKVVQKGRSLNLIDKFVLNGMQKRSSHLGEVIQRLHQFREVVGPKGNPSE